MARPRSVPDDQVFAALRHLMAVQGEKAVSFASVARATGLAGASLVQRYGSRDGMIRAALLAGWDALDAATTAADAAAETAQALLKTLGNTAPDIALLALGVRDAALRGRAAAWRARVEAALTARLHSADSAALLFAVWQGQLLWQAVGDKGFRLKDAVKRLG